MAVSWSIGDDVSIAKTVQTAALPVRITISNSSIVNGATAWQIIGDDVRVIGRSTQNGVLALDFTEDPVITAANVSPVPLFGEPLPSADGYEVDITNYDSTYGWDAPIVSAGTVSVVSTIGNIRKLKVVGLSVGQSATITQRNYLNSTYQTGTLTASATAAVSSGRRDVQNPVVELIKKTMPAKKLTIGGFKAGSAKLTVEMKQSIRDFVDSENPAKKITCAGSVVAPSPSKSSLTLSKNRAKAVCGYLAVVTAEIATAPSKTVTAKFIRGKAPKSLVKITSQ
jgi:hypothetical protein